MVMDTGLFSLFCMTLDFWIGVYMASVTAIKYIQYHADRHLDNITVISFFALYYFYNYRPAGCVIVARNC